MPISRKKSCTPCRKSKARCNLASTCSRCSERALKCTYSDSARILSSSPRIATTPRNISNDVNPSVPSLDIEEDFNFGLASDPIGVMSGMCSWPSSTWNDQTLLRPNHENMFGVMPEQLNREIYATLSPVLNTQISSGNGSVQDQAVAIYGKVYHNLLAPRKSMTGQALLTSHIIWSQLKSYPPLLFAGQLPPFIYPTCVLNEQLPQNCILDGVHQCLPEPLAVCVALLRLFESRTPASSPFVWTSIYTELNRLKDEVG